jgi:hypothetical protein
MRWWFDSCASPISCEPTACTVRRGFPAVSPPIGVFVAKIVWLFTRPSPPIPQATPDLDAPSSWHFVGLQRSRRRSGPPGKRCSSSAPISTSFPFHERRDTRRSSLVAKGAVRAVQSLRRRLGEPTIPCKRGKGPRLNAGALSKQLLLMIVVELPSNCTCREFGVVNVYVVLIRVLDDVVNQVTAHIGRASPHPGDRVR